MEKPLQPHPHEERPEEPHEPRKEPLSQRRPITLGRTGASRTARPCFRNGFGPESVGVAMAMGGDHDALS